MIHNIGLKSSLIPSMVLLLLTIGCSKDKSTDFKYNKISISTFYQWLNKNEGQILRGNSDLGNFLLDQKHSSLDKSNIFVEGNYFIVPVQTTVTRAIANSSNDLILKNFNIELAFPIKSYTDFTFGYRISNGIIKKGKQEYRNDNEIKPEILFPGKRIESIHTIKSILKGSTGSKVNIQDKFLVASPTYIMPPPDEGGVEICTGTLYTIYQQDCYAGDQCSWYIIDQYFVGTCSTSGSVGGTSINNVSVTVNPLCPNSIKFTNRAGGYSQESNLVNLRFVDPMNINNIKQFDMYVQLNNGITYSGMYRERTSSYLVATKNAFGFLNDWEITRTLLQSGEISSKVNLNGDIE